jgi:hypothetical protein
VSIDFETISISNETSRFITYGVIENKYDFDKLLLLEVIDKCKPSANYILPISG